MKDLVLSLVLFCTPALSLAQPKAIHWCANEKCINDQDGNPVIILGHPILSCTRHGVVVFQGRFAKQNGHKVYLWPIETSAPILIKWPVCEVSQEVDWTSVGIDPWCEASPDAMVECNFEKLSDCEYFRDSKDVCEHK